MDLHMLLSDSIYIGHRIGWRFAAEYLQRGQKSASSLLLLQKWPWLYDFYAYGLENPTELLMRSCIVTDIGIRSLPHLIMIGRRLLSCRGVNTQDDEGHWAVSHPTESASVCPSCWVFKDFKISNGLERFQMSVSERRCWDVSPMVIPLVGCDPA